MCLLAEDCLFWIKNQHLGEGMLSFVEVYIYIQDTPCFLVVGQQCSVLDNRYHMESDNLSAVDSCSS